MLQAIACGVRKTLLIFNTSMNLPPIYVINPLEFNIIQDSEIPIVLAYNTVHYENYKLYKKSRLQRMNKEKKARWKMNNPELQKEKQKAYKGTYKARLKEKNWEKLFDGTVPSNNCFVDGTVPSNNCFLDGTVPSNNLLFDGTLH